MLFLLTKTIIDDYLVTYKRNLVQKCKKISPQRDKEKKDYEENNKAKPNRFATPREKDRVVVVLDPDISHVFKTSESVNKVLRALITAMPKSV